MKAKHKIQSGVLLAALGALALDMTILNEDGGALLASASAGGRDLPGELREAMASSDGSDPLGALLASLGSGGGVERLFDTRPAPRPVTPQAEQGPMNLSISSIITGRRELAVINGRAHEVGEIIDTARAIRLVAIQHNGIWVERDGVRSFVEMASVATPPQSNPAGEGVLPDGVRVVRSGEDRAA